MSGVSVTRPEMLTFVKGEDGRVRVQSWPDVIEISKHFLTDPPSNLTDWHLEVCGDEVRFDVPNGSARYVRVLDGELCDRHAYRKVVSSLEFPS